MESFSAEAIPRYKQCDWTFKMGKHVQAILHGHIIQSFAVEKHSLLALTSESWKRVEAMLEYEGGLPAPPFPLTSLYSPHRDGTLRRQRSPPVFLVLLQDALWRGGGGGAGCGLLNPILIICLLLPSPPFPLGHLLPHLPRFISLGCSTSPDHPHTNRHCIYEDVSVHICIQILYPTVRL